MDKEKINIEALFFLFVLLRELFDGVSFRGSERTG
jgi:hypothetical protein